MDPWKKKVPLVPHTLPSDNVLSETKIIYDTGEEETEIITYITALDFGKSSL